MDWKYVFFSFRGRLRRKDFWIATLIQYAVIFVVFGAGESVRRAFGFSPVGIVLLGLFGLVDLAWVVFGVWAGLAVSVKRCHDRNQSGWWVLLQLIPIIGAFWALINLGILDGTPADNQFGPSPKFGPGQSEVFA
jgi:uncharacterized membrane protein YhaH (DUF805 family)